MRSVLAGQKKFLVLEILVFAIKFNNFLNIKRNTFYSFLNYILK